MRTRVLAALLFASGCVSPAFKNFTSGNSGPSTEETSSSSGTSGGSSGDVWSGSGSIETTTPGSGGMTMASSSTDETTGSSSTDASAGSSSTTTDSASTGTSGVEPVCGDGVVEGDEECDDGNIDWVDGCNQVCARDRLVFATDEVFVPFQVGGAEIADDI